MERIPGAAQETGGMRTFGVTEQLLLVDVRTGKAVPRARAVLERYRLADVPGAGPTLVAEEQQEVVTAITPSHSTLAALATSIIAGRTIADLAAQQVGLRVAALGTAPVVNEPDSPRRLRSLPSRERSRRDIPLFDIPEQCSSKPKPPSSDHLTCGCHIHVSVESADEAVAVLDRIRIWLPVLIALSANSPFWEGKDTGFASYRSRVASAWPSAGPLEILGSPDAYRRLVQGMVSAGVVVDEGKVCFDARMSRTQPAVEIRLADVCLRPETAVLLAGLARGLVETAAREWREGIPPVQVCSAMLRLAGWKAGRWGLRRDLLDPYTSHPAPAVAVVNSLLDHVRTVLEEMGDLERVEELLDDLLHSGTAAARQVRVLERTGGLDHVVVDAVNCTVWALAGRPGRPLD